MPTIKMNGVDLSYTERGRGMPLVLLHAFPVDSRVWAAQIEALSGKFRVIAPDFRGFGQSKSSDTFSMDSLAEYVHGLLEAIRAVPCVLAGISMGGYVALSYVRKYPTELRGLILVDTKAEGDTAEQKEARQKMVELVRAKGAAAVADQMIPRMLAPDAASTRPEQARALREMIEDCPPLTIEHGLLAMRDRPDRSPILPSIAVPTLIVVGDADAITPVSMAESMKGQIPHAELSVIPGAGHLSPLEQPAQVSRAIEQFMGRIASGGH